MGEGTTLTTQSVERWLGLAALFVAPTSLITGLCYFFGLICINQRLKYFGVDPSGLGFTSADYVVTTIGVFFFAAMRVLLVCAVLVLVAVAARRWAATGRRIGLLRSLAWVLVGLGALSLGNAIVWLVSGHLPVGRLIHNAGATYTAGSILVGTTLLVAGYWVVTLTSGAEDRFQPFPAMAERALLALAVAGAVVALFWITDIYAGGFGDDQGKYNAGRLWASDSAVTLDTAEALNLPTDLVKTTVLPSTGPAGPPTYRYECLRVLEVHNGHYVLVPAKWSRDLGYAITITPDASHRITATVRAGVANSTGGAANVRPFWQCPEVVRHFGESDLDGLLIDADLARSIVGGRALTAGRIDGSMPATVGSGDTSSANGCGAESNSGSFPSVMPPYPDERTATRQQEMTGEGKSGPLWLRQRVTSFPDPASAAAYMAATQAHWGYCAGQVVLDARRGAAEPRTLASLGVQDDILAVSDAARGSTLPDCAQALGAKSNVVIQVDVCGAEQPLLGVGVVAAVRDRIPTI